MAETQHISSNGAANGDANSEYAASEKILPKRLQRFDSLHMEAGKIPGGSTHAAKAEDAMVSRYKLESPTNRIKRAQWIKNKMENSPKFKVMLFLVTVLATSMVIGDGVLTPCISGTEAMFADLGHFNIRAVQVLYIGQHLWWL
nr:unnamed protein product [Digitaria exilis]